MSMDNIYACMHVLIECMCYPGDCICCWWCKAKQKVHERTWFYCWYETGSSVQNNQLLFTWSLYLPHVWCPSLNEDYQQLLVFFQVWWHSLHVGKLNNYDFKHSHNFVVLAIIIIAICHWPRTMEYTFCGSISASCTLMHRLKLDSILDTGSHMSTFT